MCNYSNTPHAQRPLPDNRSCPANALDHQQRQRLALEALAGAQPLSHLADEHEVSRKFVYQQAGKAQQALDRAGLARHGGPGLRRGLPARTVRQWLGVRAGLGGEAVTAPVIFDPYSLPTDDNVNSVYEYLIGTGGQEGSR